jgi:hypothetical protein
MICIIFLYTEKDEKQAKTHQCYSSESVYSPKDGLRKFFSSKKRKGGKTPKHQAVFSQHFTVIKKFGALLFNEERPIFGEQL